MPLRVRKFKKQTGLDASVVFTILTRIIQSSGGILTIFMITRFLDKNEQGYYYTFWSILSIQVFFELGLSSIITQYIAHEAAHLHWKNETELEGDEYYKSRLSSLLHFTVKWFSTIAVIMFFALSLAGWLYFSHFNSELQVNWQSSWFVLSLSASLLLIIDSYFAILEGLGKIKEITRLRFLQQTINLVCLSIFLALGFKLLSAGLALAISLSITGISLALSSFRLVLLNIWCTKITSKVDYRKEILPFQFKIGTGYMSSYLIVSLITPVLFATQGTVIAGQMGATQSVLNGIMTASLSWVSTKVTLFSKLVAKHRFRQLNLVYKKYLFISTSVCITGLVIFFILRQSLHWIYLPFNDRFLPFLPMLFLGLTQIANVIGYSQGYYLRSFKKEPFFIVSIAIGILSGITTVLCSRYSDVNGITIGYFTVNGLIGFAWGCQIFIRKKKEFTHRTYDFS